jgi:hypothetical protein
MTPSNPIKNIPSADRLYFYNGVAAAMDDKPETANPHYKGTTPHRIWLEGHMWKQESAKPKAENIPFEI